MARGEGQVWMITHSPQVPDLVANCLFHAPCVDAIVIREKNWTRDQVSAFCEDFHASLEMPTQENTSVKPDLILNWNGSFDPGPLPIQGLHLGYEVALSLFRQPQLWEECFSSAQWKIGVSIHNQKEWEAVRSLPLHYVMLSNVYETPCKPGKPGLGLSQLESLFKTIQQDRPDIKGYALGGLTLQDLSSICQLGLHGIALRSAFF